MKITVDCMYDEDVRQALDFLNTLVSQSDTVDPVVLDRPGPPETDSIVYPRADGGELYGKDFTTTDPVKEFNALTTSETLRPEQPEVTEETDSSGSVWDAALHASSKMKTTKGLWKKRKGTAKLSVVTEPDVSQPPNFSDLLALVAGVISENKATIQEINSVCRYSGVDDIPGFQGKTEAIVEAFDLITMRHNTPIGG